MKFTIKKERELSKLERKELYALLTKLLTWSLHVKKYLYWSSRPQWRLIVYKDDEIIGSLSIVKRKILRDGQALLIAGIGNVGVKKEFQGKGLAQEMLRSTTAFLKKNSFNIALLFCDERRTKLYEKVEYKPLRNTVTYYSRSKLKKEPIAMLLNLNLNPKELESIEKNGLHIGRGTW